MEDTLPPSRKNHGATIDQGIFPMRNAVMSGYALVR
jgi:hypothetical protein